MSTAIERILKKERRDGKKEGGIETLIEDNLEDGKSQEIIINKLMKRFNLTEDKAFMYFEMYSKI